MDISILIEELHWEINDIGDINLLDLEAKSVQEDTDYGLKRSVVRHLLLFCFFIVLG